MKTAAVLLVLFLCFSAVYGQTLVHPRGIITVDEVSHIRDKITREPYKSWYGKIKVTTQKAENNRDATDPYQTTFLAQKQAQMYVLTGQKIWAEKCYRTLQWVINDTVYFNNPVSRGLTRATMLFGAAMCYDFCFNAWTENQQKQVNAKLFQTMLTVNSNMGFSANYAMESNWNGVRWGSALLAALVVDDFDKKYERNPALPFIWDIQKRLKDHINRNIFPGGWSAESLSYHVYNWSFIGPTLAALQNHSQNADFELENYAPHAINAMKAWSVSTVSIAHPGGKGIQPDFSDDDPQANYMLTALGLRLYPARQLPAIKWMHDYLLDIQRIDDERGYLFYSICWYPENIKSENPAKLGWLTFTDESYGVSVWRNRFKNENDIVVAFTAPVKRVAGHKGPDNLTFRIIGLGNIWVTGGGRTGEIAGQTNLFPSIPAPIAKQPEKNVESFHYFSSENKGRHVAGAAGSCMGVVQQKRKIEVVFPEDNKAVVTVADQSENGKIWRLNTPEFNAVKITSNGYVLTAPNGSTMKVTAPLPEITGKITVSKIKYGGSTSRLNSGIGFGNTFWLYNKAIDIPCNRNIQVTLKLER